MPINPVNTFATVTLDGSGNGVCKIGVSNRNQVMNLTVAAIRVTSALIASKPVPACIIYIGPTNTDDNIIDGTMVGSLNSTSRVSGHPIMYGDYIWAAWTNGNPGDIATLSIFGSIVSP